MRLLRTRGLVSASLALGLLACGWGAVQHAARIRVDRVYEIDPGVLRVSSANADLERGRHLVEVVGQCTTCHGADLAGQPMADDLWLGRLHAPNLTPGAGGIGDRSDRDLVRSIRHGVKPDGRPVVMMPSQYLHRLSDDDLAGIIAYLRRLPPVDRRAPEPRLGPLTALALVSGRAPDLIPAETLGGSASGSPAPSPDASPEYGAYLVQVAGCKVCHHEDLSGGLHALSLPGEPPPGDLRPEGPLARWTEADFVRALRTGTTPGGRRLDPAWMPWPTLAGLSDLELRAIWLHLRGLPGTEGARVASKQPCERGHGGDRAGC